MAEQVTQRLLPTAMCLTISKENAVKLIYMLILSEGIYPILSLGLPGHENDLLVKLKTLAKAKGLISETANENLSKEIVDTRSMLEYAANQGWNQVNSEMIQQMMQMGYSENQVYKCYQYVSSFLKKSVELESLLDNIEKASQMEIKQLFHGIILSPSQSSQISRPKSMSVDTGSNNLNKYYNQAIKDLINERVVFSEGVKINQKIENLVTPKAEGLLLANFNNSESQLNNFLKSRFYGNFILLNLGGPFRYIFAKIFI